MENDERNLEIERERHQQIRELDSEELQFEEVEAQLLSDDDETINDPYEGASDSTVFTFDPCLASLHTYLGEAENIHNRLSFLHDGAIFNLPLFYLRGVVLFPEATLPLRVTQPNFVAALERTLRQADARHTLAVVRLYRDNNAGKVRFGTIGTTAEIRQFRRLEDGSLNMVTRGQQRFRLIRHWFDAEGVPRGEIQVIQEDSALRTPRDAVGRLAPLRNLHTTGTFLAKRHGHGNEGDGSDTLSNDSFSSEPHADDTRESENVNLEIVNEVISDEQTSRGVGWRKHSVSRLREVPRASWPYWVYRMYDSYCLAHRVADMWKKIVKAPSMDGFIKKPNLLSFHIASKIPVSEAARHELLEIDGTSYRLRREIELLENFDSVRCKTCQRVIAKRSDMLVMSSDGPLGAYVNPGGHLHEIMTLLVVNGLALFGHPVEEYSWFPGYAWTITYCATCKRQMGWRFTAIDENLKPGTFWGIRSCQVADDMR